MQLHGRKGVAEHQPHPLCHVATAGIRLVRVVAEVGTLKEPPKDLTEGKHADDGAIVEPADEEALDIGLAAAPHPLGERLRIGRRCHPPAMKRSTGLVAGHDRDLVTVRRLAKKDLLTDFEGIREIRFGHAVPSVGERR